MDIRQIFWWVGIGLLGLGGLAGIVLLLLATFGADREDSSIGTLWGLFIVGILAGFLILLYQTC